MKNFSLCIMSFWTIAITSACNTGEFDSNKHKTGSSDTSKFERSLPFLGEKDPRLKSIKRISKQLGLSQLDRGFDSVQIRIWYPNLVVRNILVIQNSRGTWEGKLYTLDKGSIIDISTKRAMHESVKKVTPNSGWGAFTEKLFRLGVDTLPDRFDIPEYIDGIDGYEYYFEISTRSKYKFFGYWMPYLNSAKHQEAKTVVDAIRLLSEEFNIDLIVPLEST